MGACNRLILFDSGPLYANVDSNDQHHDRAETLFQTYSGLAIVPVLVTPEVAHLLQSRLGRHAEERFLRDLTRRELLIEQIDPFDWDRIVELVEQYHDLPLGTVDASIIAAAERLNISTIATFDRRHFTVVRPAHIDAIELVL